MNSKARTGQVEITMRLRRHIGPMFVHGAVTLQFDSLRPYSFVSEVEWPINANYESAVREAVEEQLLVRQGSLATTLVVLKAIEFDEVSSSPNGFRLAASAATRAAFESYDAVRTDGFNSRNPDHGEHEH